MNFKIKLIVLALVGQTYGAWKDTPTVLGGGSGLGFTDKR